MTDYAALRDEAVQFMAANQAAVDAHSGAAYPEQRILNAIAGIESTAGRALIGYAHQSVMQRGVPAVSNRAEVYTLTHAIFFATDFGRKMISGYDHGGYCALLDSLIVGYAEDLDILGELLICAKCIDHWPPAMEAALEQFISGWQALDRLDFGNNYHTILIGGILFALLV